MQGLICDQDTAAAASRLTYTGYGLLHDGTPLVPGPLGQLVVNGTSSGGNRIVPAPIRVTPGSSLSVVVGGPCRIDDERTLM
jgi:hypothetical protein